MSWMQRLIETYDACFGLEQFASNPLTPIDHAEQQAHIEVVLDQDGHFRRASVIAKENTLIPVTEKSAGRTSAPVAHPLCDKLRYVAADCSPEDHALYLEQLGKWAATSSHPKLKAIEHYVRNGTIVADLLRENILTKNEAGDLEKRWEQGASSLAKLLSADPKTKERDQANALVRWRVEIPDVMESSVWKDVDLQKEWAAFNATQPAETGLCLASGSSQPLAFIHPKGIRRGGDSAKLISSNDSPFDGNGKPRQHGFTFAGRFTRAEEAYGLSSESTQKAHNALRWLIRRQGVAVDSAVVVSWATNLAPTPPIATSTWEFYADDEQVAPLIEESASVGVYEGDAGQAFALRLKKKIQGYRTDLGDRTDVVVMALDSATPGRMAITYYRELRGSEFLDRIERWHNSLAWPQYFGKDARFVGAPAPRDIAEAAYGSRVDDKLRKATVERLLPCIVDGQPLPRDLEFATFRRAINRTGLEWWEFEKALGIACSLFRGTHPKEDFTMGLDETRKTRDYLYGRLLAIADNIEQMALDTAKEARETNAARLMQRFADHPATTWRTLELQLRPYVSRLRSSKWAGALVIRQRLLDSVISSFPDVDGDSSFNDNLPLTGEFLLGFHSQRAELLRSKTKDSDTSSEGEQQ